MTPMRSASSWAMSSECVERNTVAPRLRLVAQQVLEQADAARVEADGRLIDDQHLRLVQQRRGEDGALPHAVRVVLRQVVDERVQAEQLDHLVDAARRLGVGHAVHVGDELQELAAGEFLVEERLSGT